MYGPRRSSGYRERYVRDDAGRLGIKDVIEFSAQELVDATVDGMATQMRYAIKGQKGYRTEWPKRRRTKAVRARARKAGERPSVQTWRVRRRRKDSIDRAAKVQTIQVWNTQKHGTLLEFRERIRGRPNVHHEAAFRTYTKQWNRIKNAATADAVRRAKSNRIRKIKGRDRAAARTAGYSRIFE